MAERLVFLIYINKTFLLLPYLLKTLSCWYLMEEKNMEITVGEKIKTWRKKKDLTQEGLSRKADVPYTTLAKIESGVIKNPSIGTMQKISEGLEITIDELVS